MTRLTAQEIEAIRKRAEVATKFKTMAHPHWFEKQTYEKLAEDIPKLLVEVEALKAEKEFEEYIASEERGWSSDLYEVIRECRPLIAEENTELLAKISRIVSAMSV